MQDCSTLALSSSAVALASPALTKPLSETDFCLQSGSSGVG